MADGKAKEARPGGEGYTRRDVLEIGMGAAALAAAGQAAGEAQAAAKRPNILFLMTDQHRGDCIGADGNGAIKTPNLDRIANEGVLFRHAYTCTPSCTPARAALLTGLAPWHNGMLGYGRVATKYKNELPRMLREAGYHTFGIGKMHWHPQRALHGFHKVLLDESGRVQSKGFVSDYRQWFKKQAPALNPDATGIGWNDYRAKPYALPERLHPTRWTGDRAVEFLEGYRQQKPFFLKVSFARPHSPYDAPERLWKLYRDEDMPKPVVGRWAERNAMRGVKVGSSTPRGDLGVKTAQHSRRGYYGNVTFIDEQVGRMLKVLEDRGWLDNTLILMTADHGDMLGDHHLWRKTYAYEGSARIPMLIRWPNSIDAQRGRKLDPCVELRDVLPTFLDAAGVEVDEDEKRFDGRSMLKLIRGDTKGWREYIDLEHSRCYWPANQWTALTDGRWKYIYGAHDGTQQLFDLKSDPGECVDLASDEKHKDALALWRKRMVDHLAERGEPYVINGDLGIRKPAMLYSPHQPGRAKPKPRRKRRA